MLRLRVAGLLRLDSRICEARPRPAPPAGAEAEEHGAAERGARRRPSATDGGGRALTRMRRIEEAAAEVVAVPRRRSLRRTARRPSVLALRSPRTSADRIELAPLGPRSATVGSCSSAAASICSRAAPGLRPRRPLAAVGVDCEDRGEGTRGRRAAPEGEGGGGDDGRGERVGPAGGSWDATPPGLRDGEERLQNAASAAHSAGAAIVAAAGPFCRCSTICTHC
jgi:hypothetical protein